LPGRSKELNGEELIGEELNGEELNGEELKDSRTRELKNTGSQEFSSCRMGSRLPLL
jgi:hypothetical protein